MLRQLTVAASLGSFWRRWAVKYFFLFIFLIEFSSCVVDFVGQYLCAVESFNVSQDLASRSFFIAVTLSHEALILVCIQQPMDPLLTKIKTEKK